MRTTLFPGMPLARCSLFSGPLRKAFALDKPHPSIFTRTRSRLPPNVRHVATTLRNDVLHIVCSCISDAPERLYHTTMKLGGDWRGWEAGPSTKFLCPEFYFEGSKHPVELSEISKNLHPVNQLRDPEFLHSDDKYYLLYTVAGEYGIAIAKNETWGDDRP